MYQDGCDLDVCDGEGDILVEECEVDVECVEFEGEW